MTIKDESVSVAEQDNDLAKSEDNDQGRSEDNDQAKSEDNDQSPSVTELEEARTNYQLVIGANVPNNKKNDIAWIYKKIKENTSIEKLAKVEKGTYVKKSNSVEIYDKNGKFVRVYSAKDHGKDYEKLAKKWCDTHEDWEPWK